MDRNDHILQNEFQLEKETDIRLFNFQINQYKTMIPVKIWCFIILIIAGLNFKETRAAQSAPSGLKCEYKTNPLGIEVQNPRLFWNIPNDRRGTRQTAYQILVSGNSDLLSENIGDIWNSGKVVSDENIQIVFSGKKLASCTRYYWKVKFWDENNQESEFSKPSWFETSFLNSSEWQAKWIYDGKENPVKDEDFYKEDPSPLFRKEFNLRTPLKQARLYITGIGYYEAYINGKPVSDEVLNPGWTNYGKRIQYNSYDVTDLIQPDKNSIGVSLGNGWYNSLPIRLFSAVNLREYLTVGRPKFLAELHLIFRDGSKMIISSDGSWKVSDGPLLRNNIYLGEWYDARKEQPGWNTPDFNDSKWRNAALAEAPTGRLTAQNQNGIKITREVRPVSVSETVPGTYIFDMGQNFAGWIRFNLKGKEGNKVSFRYGELLFPDGSLNVFTTVTGQIKEIRNVDGGPGAPKTAWQEDIYTLGAGLNQCFQNHFTFHGFRYVEVSGLSYKPSLTDMTGLRLNTALEEDGEFSCSNSLFNKIQEIIQWTFLSNIFSVQSDCPARERFGYGGDIAVTGESFMHNYNMAQFYSKTVRDFADDARPSGGLTETAPFNGLDDEGLEKGSGPIGWQLAHPYLLDKLYEYYGEARLIEEQYSVLQKLVSYLQSKANGNLIPKGGFDHECISEKDIELTSSIFYYHVVQTLSHCSLILNKSEDYNKYHALGEDIKSAILSKYFKPDGRLGLATQASQIFGLWYELIPQESVGKALDLLIADIMNANEGHLTTGIFSTKMMFDVLQKFDKPDVAYTVVNQKTFPGWGYMIENEATTLWEHWAKEDTIYSRNHPMFGSVTDWFYKSVCGINQSPGSVGFRQILIKPQLTNGLTWAKGSYESVRGPIRSEWERKGKELYLHVSVPGNTSALVCIPVSPDSPVNISEGKDVLLSDGKVKVNSPFIRFIDFENRYVWFSVQSGSYNFKAY